MNLRHPTIPRSPPSRITRAISTRSDWDWTIHLAPSLGFFQVGLGSAGFNPLYALGHKPHPMVFAARFLTTEPALSVEKIKPQFRFLNESLITKGQLGLLQSLV